MCSLNSCHDYAYMTTVLGDIVSHPEPEVQKREEELPTVGTY